MAPIDGSAITDLLTNGQHRSLIGGKQLTLAFEGLYIASTTLNAKPLLVWETEKGYPRYYVPIESLHADIKSRISGQRTASSTNGHSNGQTDDDTSIQLKVLESIKAKSSDSEALIERLSIGSRSTTWVRFAEGPLMGFVRFERDEIGKSDRGFIDFS